MRQWEFVKGHGTLNDFVLIQDKTDSAGLSADEVRFLCDRRGGVGADGVIRAVQAKYMPEWDGDPGLWFMDYRNSDGSLAEMCGNGLRVFARYLVNEGLAKGPLLYIATRAGLRSAEFVGDGLVSAGMGDVKVSDAATSVTLNGREFTATAVNVGNPHAVALLGDDVDLDSLDLSHAPEFDHAVFPQGVNVEFVAADAQRSLRMRVFERGSGETMSCGTGIVATAAAQATKINQFGHFNVSVPGGDLSVEFGGSKASLIGPATLVARGQLMGPDSTRDNEEGTVVYPTR